MSYKEEALLLAMPSAIRVIANANACNSMEIIVPWGGGQQPPACSLAVIDLV